MDESPLPVVVPLLTIVRRGASERFCLLQQEFAGEPVSVTWDRRMAERRRTQSSSTEHRQHDRRRPPPTSWTTLDFLIVRAPDGHDEDLSR